MEQNRYFKRVTDQTPTRFWINNVTAKEADMALEEGAVGCTQNPSYTWKMLNGSEDETYAKQRLQEILNVEPDDNKALMMLQRELVGRIATHFMPLYEKTNGKFGYVSIQGDPLKEDAETIIRTARFNREAGANIMAKIPVTEEGIKAIRVLVREKVPINATECMAVRQVLDVCQAYEEETAGMKDPAPIYFSLITGIYDEHIKSYVKEHDIDISSDAVWQAGISIAKKVHALVNERKYNAGFISGGARGLHHFTEMVGANASVTINWHGTADKLLEQDAPVVQRFLQPTPYSIEDELVEKLEPYRKAYFINAITPEEYENFGPVVLFRSQFESAWKNAINYIREKRAQL